MDTPQEYDNEYYYKEEPGNPNRTRSFGCGGPNYRPKFRKSNAYHHNDYVYPQHLQHGPGNMAETTRFRRSHRPFTQVRGRGYTKNIPGLLDLKISRPPVPLLDVAVEVEERPPACDYYEYGNDFTGPPPVHWDFRHQNQIMTCRPFRGLRGGRRGWTKHGSRGKPFYDKRLVPSRGLDTETAAAESDVFTDTTLCKGENKKPTDTTEDSATSQNSTSESKTFDETTETKTDDGDSAKSCDICKITFDRPEDYKSHTHGLMHQKKVNDQSQLHDTETEKIDKAERNKHKPDQRDKEMSHLEGKVVEDVLSKFGISKAQHMTANLKKPAPEQRDLQLEDCGKTIFKKEFHCQLCDVKCTGVQSYQCHLHGNRHKMNVSAVAMGSKYEQTTPVSSYYITPEIPINKRKPPANKISVEQLKKTRKSRISAILNAVRDVPIVGLSYLTEFQRRDVRATVQCVCNLCELKCNEKSVKFHIVGSKHRTNYLKSCHQDMMTQVKKCSGTNKQEINDVLEQLAWEMENTDGRGQPRLEISEEEDPIPISEIDLDHFLYNDETMNQDLPFGSWDQEIPFGARNQNVPFSCGDQHVAQDEDILHSAREQQVLCNRSYDRPRMTRPQSTDNWHGPPAYDCRDQDPHVRLSPNPYRNAYEIDQQRRLHFDPYRGPQCSDEYSNRPRPDPYLSEVRGKEHVIDSWSPEARLKRLEEALKKQNVQTPALENIDIKEKSLGEKMYFLSWEVKDLESKPFLTNEEVNVLALKKYELNQAHKCRQDKDKLVQKHQRQAVLNNLSDRLSSFQRQIAMDAMEKLGGNRGDELKTHSVERLDEKGHLDPPESDPAEESDSFTAIDEVDLDKELWEDHLLREKLKIPFEYRPEFDTSPERPECSEATPAHFSPAVEALRSGYLPSAAANQMYSQTVGAGVIQPVPALPGPSQPQPMNPACLQKPSPNVGAVQNAPFTPGQPVNTGYSQNIPASSWYPQNVLATSGYPQTVLSTSGCYQNVLAPTECQQNVSINIDLPQNVSSALGLLQTSLENQPLRTTAQNQGHLTTSTQSMSRRTAQSKTQATKSDNDMDPSQIAHILENLSTSLISNEEDAAMALHVSNALTQALLTFRLKSLPREADAATRAITQIKETQRLIEEKQKQLLETRHMKGKESLKRHWSGESPTDVLATGWQVQGESEHPVKMSKSHTHDSKIIQSYTQDLNQPVPGVVQSTVNQQIAAVVQSPHTNQQVPKIVPPPYNMGSQAVNPLTQSAYQPIPRMTQLDAGSNHQTHMTQHTPYVHQPEYVYTPRYMPSQYPVHPPPAPPLPFTAPPEKPPPPPSPPSP